MRIEALIGDAEGGRGVVGLVGQEGRTERIANPETFAVLDKCAAGVIDYRSRVVWADAGEEAEFVPTEAVGRTGRPDRVGKPACKAGQQRVACGVAKPIVVS